MPQVNLHGMDEGLTLKMISSILSATIKEAIDLHRMTTTSVSATTSIRPYFEKCIAFLQDSDGKQFVVLQWFHRHEDNGFDTISRVPSFKLGPEAHTKSYSTLPLHTILNGALMVPGGGRYWAVLSPREHKTYARFFQ